MKLVFRSLAAVFRRPSILLFLGVFAALFTLISYLGVTPLTQTLGIVNEMGRDGISTNLLDSFYLYVLILNSLLGFLKDPFILICSIGGVIAFVILFGALLSLVLSGYFNTVYHALDKKKSKKFSFVEGIKAYFIRIWKINILFLFITIVTFIVGSVALVPSVTFLMVDIQGYFMWGVILSIVTAIVLFFTSVYYIIYMSFWYPAVYSVDTKPFKYSKRLVDQNFLGVFLRIVFVGIFFLVCNTMLDLLTNSMVEAYKMVGLIVKWLFNTIFFAFATTYIFALYRFLDKRFTKQQEIN